jgi:hypothetical protein
MTPGRPQAMTAEGATALNQVASTNDATRVPQLPLWVAGSMGHCNTALSLSAGVSNPKVFLGRWFRRNAIVFKYD